MDERSVPADSDTWLAAQTDASLVASFGIRPAAFAEVCRRHQRAMRRVAVQTCGVAQADDVVQEVLERLWSRPNGFDPDRGSLHAYLWTQTRHRAIDVLRSEISRRAREAADHKTVSSSDVEADALFAGDIRKVASRMLTLPQIEREPIALAYFAGHSYKEVAELLGLPEGTVKSRIRSGLRRLRVHLGE